MSKSFVVFCHMHACSGVKLTHRVAVCLGSQELHPRLQHLIPLIYGTRKELLESLVCFQAIHDLLDALFDGLYKRGAVVENSEHV